MDHELVYLLDNSDASVVIYGAEFAGHVAAIRDQLPRVTQWVEVGDGYPAARTWCPYEDLVAQGDGAPLDIQRSADDLLFLYTGGTTGMPKGVMWRHDDLWRVTGAGGNPRLGQPPSEDLDAYIRAAAAGAAAGQSAAAADHARHRTAFGRWRHGPGRHLRHPHRAQLRCRRGAGRHRA